MSIIGPKLPPLKASEDNNKNEIEDVYGPRLPPKLVVRAREEHPQNSERIVGPVLPPELLATLAADADSGSDDSDDSEDIIGPQLPSKYSDDTALDVRDEFSKRASKMKQRLLGKPESDQLQREEWMTVLPPELSKNFGLGPRTFQRQAPHQSGDRSGWTETPSTSSKNREMNESKAQKSEDEKKMKQRNQEKYDQEMNKIAEKHHKKSKRSESLLDMHTKDRKRKKKKEDAKERVPFDRDKDLRLNVMDNAKRAALVKNSKLLRTNFAHGEGKYL